MRLTSLLLMPSIPSARTRSSNAPRADATQIGLLDDRQQRPLGTPARLEQAGEVAAVAHARDGQLDRADPSIRAPLAIAVAMGQASIGLALAAGGARDLADLGLHDRLGEDAHALAQDIDVASAACLAKRVEQSHAVVGHRGVPPVVGSYSNDVRMTRWPQPRSAYPALLHQVWGLNPRPTTLASNTKDRRRLHAGADLLASGPESSNV